MTTPDRLAEKLRNMRAFSSYDKAVMTEAAAFIESTATPVPGVSEAFEGTVDGDTPLQAAAREAGWALMEIVDSIDWTKREQVSDIVSRLGQALNHKPEALEAAVQSPPAGGRVNPFARMVYIASKVIHADRWRTVAAAHPISSSWIYEAGQGETTDFDDLWRRCMTEAANSKALVIYREPGEVMKGAWAELGVALSHGVPVHAVGIEEFTIAKFKGITHHASMKDAMTAALLEPSRALAAPVEAVATEPVAWRWRWTKEAAGLHRDSLVSPPWNYCADDNFGGTTLREIEPLYASPQGDKALRDAIAKLWPNSFGPKNLDELVVFIEEERKCDAEYRTAMSPSPDKPASGASINIDALGMRLYTLENENERLRAEVEHLNATSDGGELAELRATVERLTKERDGFRRMCRENYDAFSAMRNDINEIIGDMASQESTLLDGPEMQHECVAVVVAVRKYAEARLAAGSPDTQGMVLVPREPTRKMLDTVGVILVGEYGRRPKGFVTHLWEQFLDAALTSTAEQGEAK